MEHIFQESPASSSWSSSVVFQSYSGPQGWVEWPKHIMQVFRSKQWSSLCAKKISQTIITAEMSNASGWKGCKARSCRRDEEKTVYGRTAGWTSSISNLDTPAAAQGHETRLNEPTERMGGIPALRGRRELVWLMLRLAGGERRGWGSGVGGLVRLSRTTSGVACCGTLWWLIISSDQWNEMRSYFLQRL